MWCSHQQQQMGIPTLIDHLPVFAEDLERISAIEKLSVKDSYIIPKYDSNASEVIPCNRHQ